MKIEIFNVKYKNKTNKLINKYFENISITQNLIKEENNDNFYKINNELFNVIINFFVRKFNKDDYIFSFSFEEMKYYTRISNNIILSKIYEELFNIEAPWKNIYHNENGYPFIVPNDFNYEFLNGLIQIINKLEINLKEKEEYMISSIFNKQKYKELKITKIDFNDYLN